MQRARIFRLESYLKLIDELKSAGRATVTSQDLAQTVGVSSSRVRQDLIFLQGAGKPRAGYDLDEISRLLYRELDILSDKGMVLIGCGNLGRALILSSIWKRSGFKLRAIFDNDARVVGETINGLTVRHIREMYGVIHQEAIVAACITAPASAAGALASMLVQAGIKAIWNFAPVEICVPAGVIVENQRLEQGLMTLSYLIKQAQRPSAAYELENNVHDPSCPGTVD